MRMQRSGRRRGQDDEDSMQMTWQERVLSAVAIVGIFVSYRSSVGKRAAGGVPTVGLQLEIQ